MSTPITALKPAATMTEMVAALEKSEQNTTFVADTLEQWVYERDSEYGSLNKNRQKLVLTQYSAKQLCRTAGIPYSVFYKASPELATELLEEFVPSMKEKERKFALKEYSGKTMLRAVLPLDYPDVRNSEVLRSVRTVFKDCVVVAAPWMDKADAPFLATRLVFPGQGKEINKDQLYLGAEITSSELGAGKLLLNVLLFRLICENGAIASYENHPYFSYDYSGGGLSINLEDVLQASGSRMEKDTDVYWAAVSQAMSQRLTQKEAAAWVQQLEEKRQLNKGVMVKVQRHIEKHGTSTLWDFINAITATARGYREQLRSRYETTAGQLLGLKFSRTREEDTFLVEVKKALPPSAATAVAITA